jgi:hypothetical protein
MSVPAALYEIQKWAGAMIARPLGKLGSYGIPIYDEKTREEASRWISPGPFLTPEQRIGIYNQQYWFRLLTILQEAYPTLLRLFGFEDFNKILAEPFLISHPPGKRLGSLGEKLPKWIEGAYEGDDKRLVLAAARVDALYEENFVAPSFPPLSAADFGSIETQKLYLQPTISLIELDADFFSFRRELLKESVDFWADQAFPLLEAPRKRNFVLHQETGFEEVGSTEFALLMAFQQGAFLEEALSLVSIEEAPLLSEWFQKWSQRGGFSLGSGCSNV